MPDEVRIGAAVFAAVAFCLLLLIGYLAIRYAKKWWWRTGALVFAALLAVGVVMAIMDASGTGDSVVTEEPCAYYDDETGKWVEIPCPTVTPPADVTNNPQ